MLDHNKFAPAVVLTDIAPGFEKALQIMKEHGWSNVRHLYYRGISMKQSNEIAASGLPRYLKGTKGPEMNRFIDAFRNIVLAPNSRQMHALWESMMEGEGFPQEAVDWVFKEYYNNPKARQFMECYVYDCGNLHQTTTSRNEGSHAAYRSKTTIIPKLTDAYKDRRIHKKQWMQRLHAAAWSARNHIPLDIQAVPELRQIAGKLSIFALTEIRQQLILAKKEAQSGRVSVWRNRDRCTCHAYVRYGLPCLHMMPTDGSPIQLEKIASMWRLDNWDQGSL